MAVYRLCQRTPQKPIKNPRKCIHGIQRFLKKMSSRMSYLNKFTEMIYLSKKIVQHIERSLSVECRALRWQSKQNRSGVSTLDKTFLDYCNKEINKDEAS